MKVALAEKIFPFMPPKRAVRPQLLEQLYDSFVREKPINVIDLKKVILKKPENCLQQRATDIRNHKYIKCSEWLHEYEILKKCENLTYDNYDEIFGDMNPDLYDLPQRFAIAANNTAKIKGSALIVNEMPQIFKGIEKGVLAKSLDKLAAALDEDTLNKFSIDHRKFQATAIKTGTTSRTYKIEDKFGNKVVLKVAKNPNDIGSHGIYGETAIHQEMQRANVCNIPKLYMANPVGKYVEVGDKVRVKGAWQLTEYIPPGATVKKDGIRFEQWLDDNDLEHRDLNVYSQIGDYCVDLGGIVTKYSYSDYRGLSWVTPNYVQGQTTSEIVKAFKS